MVQTVVLNTPGKQDGAFALDVNGKRVIDKHGVFYRDVLWPSSGKTTTNSKPKTTTSTSRVSEATTLTSVVKPTTTKRVADPLGDILGPLLSEITHLLRRHEPTATTDFPSAMETGIWEEPAEARSGSGEYEESQDDGDDSPFGILAIPQREGNSIGFVGIFFRQASILTLFESRC